VQFDRPVGDQLDVVYRHQPVAGVLEGAVTVRYVEDGVADGLPDRATPAVLERLVDLVGGVGWRRRGQPERVGALDAREVDAEVSHGPLLSRRLLCALRYRGRAPSTWWAWS